MLRTMIPAASSSRRWFNRPSANTKAQALGRFALFGSLGRDELERLAIMTEDIDLPAGKVLLREGATAYQFFLIAEGEVEVMKGGELVRRLGPGDFFGETGLIERTPLGTTVRAETPVRCFVMSSQGFWRLIESDPEVERRILRTLVVQNVHERQIAEDALRRQA